MNEDRKLLTQALEAQLGSLGEQGVDKIKEFLNGKAVDEGNPWKRAAYIIIANGVDAFGPLGVNKALNALHDLIEGKPVDIDWADLEASSNVVAHMQNQEATHRETTKLFLVQLGMVLQDVITGMILSLV